MQDATVGSQDAPIAGYSLQEAAALLGIGVNTLRRRIAAGQVQAERAQRPQGYVWRVYLEGRHPPSQPTNHPTDQEVPRSLPQPPTPLARADALASLIQATLTPIIGPLVAEVTASRQTIERLADQLVSQAETIGHLRAEVETTSSEAIALKVAEHKLVNAVRERMQELEALRAEMVATQISHAADLATAQVTIAPLEARRVARPWRRP